MKCVLPFLLAVACAWPAIAHGDEPHDAPDPAHPRPAATADAPASYPQALADWRSAEAVNDWLGARFTYDRDRALALSETARAAGGRTAVIEPQAFFAAPHGVCVDMARFAVATLREVDPAAQASYLTIEFAPVEIAGRTLRRHWMAAFRRDGRYYFFADSRRPGHLAGPYASVDEFVAEYAAYRGRAVVSYRLADSYERSLRRRASPASGR
jgi:hypothetical protein